MTTHVYLDIEARDDGLAVARVTDAHTAALLGEFVADTHEAANHAGQDFINERGEWVWVS